jgi:hypothetical protein
VQEALDLIVYKDFEDLPAVLQVQILHQLLHLGVVVVGPVTLQQVLLQLEFLAEVAVEAELFVMGLHNLAVTEY